MILGKGDMKRNAKFQHPPPKRTFSMGPPPLQKKKNTCAVEWAAKLKTMISRFGISSFGGFILRVYCSFLRVYGTYSTFFFSSWSDCIDDAAKPLNRILGVPRTSQSGLVLHLMSASIVIRAGNGCFLIVQRISTS